MTGNTQIKPPLWFWIVGAAALIWNLFGVMAYLGQAFMGDEAKSALPKAQLDLMEATPSWVTAAFALAVWGGLLGSIGLLLRKKWARPLFTISLLGVLVQNAYYSFMTNAYEVVGQVQGFILPLMVILVAIGLVLLARKSVNRNWIT